MGAHTTTHIGGYGQYWLLMLIMFIHAKMKKVNNGHDRVNVVDATIEL